jgi:molybdate transport system ATP-binding protein
MRSARRDRRPVSAQISGGQKQRVALARALAAGPISCCSTNRSRRWTRAARAHARELRALQAKPRCADGDDFARSAGRRVLGDHVLEIRDGRIFASGRGKRHPPVYAQEPARIA